MKILFKILFIAISFLCYLLSWNCGTKESIVNPLIDTTYFFVYQNNFESSIGNEWSNTKTDITPKGGRKFLGQFGNDTISLNLKNLQAHDIIKISFDLFIIASWDGYLDANRWTLRINDGRDIFQKSFSFSNFPSYPQSYPNESGLPGKSNVSEPANSLGFTDSWGGGDAVYHMEYNVSSSSDNIMFYFYGNGLEPITNESWGIDNIVVQAGLIGKISEKFHLSNNSFFGIFSDLRLLFNNSSISKSITLRNSENSEFFVSINDYKKYNYNTRLYFLNISKTPFT